MARTFSMNVFLVITLLASLPTNTISTLCSLLQLPKPKKETKWEAYAKLKGIQKKKKERMVWDETHKVRFID